ncbi:MAG: glucose-6-phosphate isomerase [Bacilli bacterium]|nr:glucose-6-phosphate isomerase [Bacilli bacterium]
MIKFDETHGLFDEKIEDFQPQVTEIHKSIREKTGKGNDFLGWVDWANTYDKEEFDRMLKLAEKLNDKAEVVVVCGIGGSYLGARAAIEAINGLFPSDKLEIIYLGQTFSSTYIAQVLAYLKTKKFAINVISKSGTTTETSISFRLLKELLEAKVGKEEARKAIFATTDKEKGALKTLCDKEGYETFVLPGDIGGRYSVLTAVGTFPIACAGIDVKKLLKGAEKAMNELNNPDIKTNPCYQYAVTRDYMYRHKKQVEMFVTYEPSLTMIGEWLKQLFGESEGKQHRGLLPTSVTFSTDLHSLGQFIQDGTPLLFETTVFVKKPALDVKVPADKENLDGLNYLKGKKLSFVNEKAFEGTLNAHASEGKVPNVVIELEKLTSESLGYLFYFFMRACAMSAYLLKVNPFNQEGVEVYKKRMFHLLGKPGY